MINRAMFETLAGLSGPHMLDKYQVMITPVFVKTPEQGPAVCFVVEGYGTTNKVGFNLNVLEELTPHQVKYHLSAHVIQAFRHAERAALPQ